MKRVRILSLALLYMVTPVGAHAVSGDTADAVADILVWVVIVIVPILLMWLFWKVHVMPEATLAYGRDGSRRRISPNSARSHSKPFVIASHAENTRQVCCARRNQADLRPSAQPIDVHPATGGRPISVGTSCRSTFRYDVATLYGLRDRWHCLDTDCLEPVRRHVSIKQIAASQPS